MNNLSAFDITLLIVAVYIAIYGIVNRVCKCIEKFAYAKCYEMAKKEIGNEQSGNAKSGEGKTEENRNV